MKFVHAADIHLDSPMAGLAAYDGAPLERLRGATRQALVNLVDLAIEEAASFVVIAGDLYDGDWRDFNTGLFFCAQMTRLDRQGIPVFVVQGNHDAESAMTKRLPLPGNVTVFSTRRAETKILDGLRVAIHGRSFASRDVSDNLAATYPAPVKGMFNIGLLHTACDGRAGHAPYAPCTAAELAAKGYEYWALGHVHRREVLNETPYIVFPGNTQGRHARETGPKGCTLVTVEDGAVTALEHRDLDVVRWAQVEIDASACAGLDEVVETALSALEDAAAEAGGRLLAARLRFTGRSPAHAALTRRGDQLAAELRASAMGIGAEGAWIEKILIETRPPVETDKLLQRGDSIGALARSVGTVGPEDMAALSAELADLWSRMPKEAREEGDDDMAVLLREGADLLLARLAEEEAGE
ncbi:DNA repair exonuclease [Telmatospirillum sp. J64-1]|uniref:metallophosphoesterase family protein n=1 Tax=Telmatospirillum sp. J64-1 TaxID=2502183 RepID=UPI001C8F24CE|nr:DNA repair exonuclease [Telmatospirillum sp. J64-1]